MEAEDLNVCNPNMLQEAQILMLQLSEKDIKDGRLTNQNEVDKSDFDWLKTLGFQL